MSIKSAPEQARSEAAFFNWRPDMGLFGLIRADWVANKDSQKGRIVMVLFRLASWFRRKNRVTYIIGIPYLVMYRLAVEWVLGVEIPPLTRIGSGFAVHHGQGIVLNNRTEIGENCLIRQGVTLGNSSSEDVHGCPSIGDGVVIGANALVLGRLMVGDNAVVGAGAVVVKDVAPGTVVVGNPARVLEKR